MTLRRASIIGVGGAVALVAGRLRGRDLAAPAAASASWPTSASSARAASEYNDGRVQALAAYYYSQRSHDSRWLLVEFALSGRHPAICRPNRDRAGHARRRRSVPLAAQRAWGEDVARTRQLLQEARTQPPSAAAVLPGGSAAQEPLYDSSGAPNSGQTVIDASSASRSTSVRRRPLFASPTRPWACGVATCWS